VGGDTHRLDGIDEDDETRELEDEADLDLDTTKELRETTGKVREKKDEPWWFTFRFRPILGVVSLHDGEWAREIEEKTDTVMEVVLVERPVWDLDLPPRFVGSHER